MCTCKSLCVLLCLLLFALSPAGGAWLVTKDGGRIETKGPWKLDGDSVVFTQTNGTLASLRLTQIDLPASQNASDPAAEAGAPGTGEEREEPILVLTDEDIGHHRYLASQAAEGETGTSRKGKKTPAEDELGPQLLTPGNGEVVVRSWEQVKDPRNTNSVEIVGTLANYGTSLATNMKVVVLLYDEEEVLIGAASAPVQTKALAPQDTVGFRAVFPGVVSFARAKFEVEFLNLLFAPVEPKE